MLSESTGVVSYQLSFFTIQNWSAEEDRFAPTVIDVKIEGPPLVYCLDVYVGLNHVFLSYLDSES